MFRCDKCPFVTLGEDLLDESSVHCVTGAFGDNVADKGEAEKGNIANQVQHFVSNKFVGKPKAGLIDDAFLRQDHGIIQCPALSQSRDHKASTSCKNPKVRAVAISCSNAEAEQVWV